MEYEYERLHRVEREREERGDRQEEGGGEWRTLRCSFN
jgi:hypothetical protein